MTPPNQSEQQDLKTESQEGGSETGAQSGEPTPKSMSDPSEGPSTFLSADTNPELYEGLGMDLSQFQDDPSAPTSQASDLTLFNPEQDAPGNLAPDFEDLEAGASTNQVSNQGPNQESNQMSGGSQVDPPEMSFDSPTSIEDLQSDVTYGDKVLTGLANGEDVSRPKPAVDVREPTAEGYDNTDIPFVRKLFGEDIQEVADPTGSLDEQTPITNTVEDITGDNIPSIGATIGEGIQYLTGQEYDMSDQEVVQWLNENNPDFARQIDPENPEQSMENLNEYAKRRLKQRQRRDAHDTLFPELRFSMAAKAPDPEVRREIMEMDDKELTSQYARRAYQNQEIPAGADIIDDMISEGQSQLEEIREENPEMFIEAEDPKELGKAGNKLEEHIQAAKEGGEKPGKLVYYRDEDTGAEITFASPEKLDQYAKERRWRDLNYRDRGAVEEWLTGGLFRSNVTLADLGAEVAQYGARLANQTGDVGEAAYEGATGMDPDAVVDQIEGFQRDLTAIRETSQISESDDIKNKNFLSDEEGELFGEAVLSPAKLASVAGETLGLSAPGIGAAGAAGRVGKTLLGGMKMWGRAKKLRELAKAGKTTEAGKEITEGMIRSARFKEQAAKAGIAAAMYEMPLESAESLKTLYREEEDPSAGDQALAITSGMLSGYIGSFGDMALYDVLSKSSRNALGNMDDELADEAIKGQAAEMLHAAKQKAKEGAKALTLETLTENSQEITKDVADQFRSGKYETFEEFVDDNAEKYARTTVGSLSLSLFTGGIGGGRVAADIIKQGNRRHMQKVFNRIGTDELQNWMGENSGVARIYNDIRREGGDLAFAAEALNDTEALNQFETFFREQTEEDVASDLEIDIVKKEGDKVVKVDHVRGVEELMLRAPEISEQVQGQTPESSSNVEGMELVPEELDAVEDKGDAPRTEPIDGFQNEFETPLGKTFEGEGAKSQAREASEAEQFVGAVIDNDGEKQVVTRVDNAGQDGDTEFRSRPVTGGQERVLENAPTSEDVVAWRDKVSDLDRSSSVARKREAHIETANHENTQPYEDAKELVDEAAENGTIDEEEASEVKAKVDRYRDHQDMIASVNTSQDLRRSAMRKRNELLSILQNDLDQIFQAENQEDVTRDLTQTVNQNPDGGSGEGVPDRPEPIPETEDAPPQPSEDTGISERPDDISETDEAPPQPTASEDGSSEESAAEDAASPESEADYSAAFDALEEAQAEAIQSEMEGTSGRDAKTLQNPKSQTWRPAEETTRDPTLVFGPDGQRARVESVTTNKWYTLQPEDGGEPIKTRKGDGEWTKVPPSVEVEVTDPSEQTNGDPSGMTGEEANEAANQDTDAAERRTANPDDPIDQQVADVYASHLNDPDLGDQGKANPRLFRDTLPQEWEFDTVSRDKAQGPNSFGRDARNPETYWKVDTPDGSFLLPEPQIDVRSDETDTPEFSGVLGEMGTAEFGFGVSRDTARNNPSEISPVPYRDGRARPEGDSSVTTRSVDDSRGPDAPELTLSSGDLRATELTETNVTVRDNGLSDSLDERDFVYRSSVINDDVETRIQNQGQERDESVAVISKGGRHTSEIRRVELEEMGLQSSERQSPDRDVSSADRGIEVNLAVNRALSNPSTAESERALENDLRDQGLDADVRTVRAETVDGKTVFRERGETTTTDDAQEFLVADVEGMEFIAPRVDGNGNIPDAQPLSGFSNRTYNESNYSTENGVPYENFDTTLDHAGQRVATDYFKSGQHSTDESSQYQGETVDYEDQTLRLESDDTSPLDMKKVYKSLNQDLSDVESRRQEVQEEKIEIQSRAEREALERDDVSNPEDIQRAEQEILDDNDTYQELLDREGTLENKRQEITEKQSKIRQEVVSRMEESSSRTADDILPQRSDQQQQQDTSGPTDPTAGIDGDLGGTFDEDVVFSSQRTELQDMPNANGNTGSPTRVVREVASTLSGMWDAIPRMRVVSSVSDLPSHIQSDVGTNLSRVEGVFDGRTGQLYLVSENLNTKTQALNVALHEVAGHFGMREIVRDGDFKPLMREVFRALEGKVLEGDGTLRDAEAGERNQTLLRRVAQEDVVLDRDEGDAGLSSDEAKVRAAEEAMARIAETQPSPGVLESLWARLYSAVRRAVRPAANALGLDPLSISNAEIRWMMSAARNTLSEKGTTVTVDSQGVRPLPWTEMQMISPTFVSRMSNALQNPSDQTRETLRDGDPVDAEVMQSLISDLEGDLFRPGEAEAIGLGEWLSQKADAGEQVTLSDVQSYIEEHQVHVSENQLGTEGSPVENARQRVQRFRERVEEIRAEESRTYRDLDYATLDAQERIRDAAEEAGATAEQAQQLSVRFQKVVDEALNNPQANPLSSLRDSLESQGFDEQIINIVDDIAQQIDEYASVLRRVEDAQTRLEDAQQEFQSVEEEAGSDVRVGTELAFVLPDVVKERVVQSRINRRRQRLREVRAERDSALEELQSERQQDGQTNRARDLELQVQELRQQIETLNAQIQGLEANLESGSISNLDVPNVLSGLRVTERTEDGSTVLSIEEQTSGNQEINEALQSDAQSLLARRLALYATEKGYDAVDLSSAESLTDGFEQVANAFGGTVQDGRAEISDRMKTELPERGAPLFRSSERQIDSDAFKQWFGDWQSQPSTASKAVDPDTGEPLVVYHGSGSDFTQFADTNPIYTTPETTDANNYAGDRAQFGGESFDSVDGANVMPLYVKAQRPLDLRSMGDNPTQDMVIDRIADEGLITQEEANGIKNELAGRKAQTFAVLEEAFDALKGNNIHSRIRNSGKFDSVAFRDERPAPNRYTEQEIEGDSTFDNTSILHSDSWVVYDKTQVKSATGNEGTFFNGNGDIRYSSQQSESDGTAATEKAGRGQDPDLEDIQNVQSVVGQIKKMLSQMQVPGTDGYLRTKEFALENGYQDLVDEQIGKIEVQDYSDLQSVAELAGKMLYFEFRDAAAEKGWDISNVYAELDSVAQDIEGIDQETSAEDRRAAAMAKLIGQYLQGDSISNLAENLEEEFNAFAEEYKMKKNLDHVRDVFRAYRTQSDLTTAYGMMNIRNEGGYASQDVKRSETFGQWLQKKREQYYTQMYDMYYPTYKVMRDMNGGKVPQNIQDNTYLMTRMADGASGVARSFLSDGIYALSQDPTEVSGDERLGPSLREALQPVSQSQRAYRQFARYAIARRAEELIKQKNDPNHRRPEDFPLPDGLETLEQVQMVYDHTFGSESETFGSDDLPGRGHDQDAFEEAFDKLQEYNNGLLEYAVREGYLSREEKQKIQEMNEAYVPWNRVMEATRVQKGGEGDMIDGLNFITGNRDLAIDNPIQHIIQNTHSLVNAVHKNRIYQSIYNNIPTGEDGRNVLVGSFAEVVEKPQNIEQITKDRMKNTLLNNGADSDTADEVIDQLTGDEDSMLSIFMPARMENLPDQIVQAKVGGESVYLRLNEDMYNSIHHTTEPYQNILARFGRGVQKSFRNLTTAQNPVFGFIEFLRDAVTRGIQTKTDTTPQAIVGMIGAGFDTAIPLLFPNADMGEVNEAIQGFKQSAAWGATQGIIDQDIRSNEESRLVGQAQREETGVGAFMKALGDYVNAKNKESPTFAGITDMLGITQGRAEQASRQPKDASFKDAWMQSLGRFASPSALRNFNDALENTNRLKEYRRSYDKIMTKFRDEYDGPEERLADDEEAHTEAKRRASLRAGYRARNVTIDFARKGKWSEQANRYVPFFNAALQGWDRAKVTLQNNPRRAMEFVTATQIIPAIAVAMMNTGNPYYEEKGLEKDQYFLIPKSGSQDKNGHATSFWRIPKTHIYGPLFASPIERFVNYAVKEGHIDKSNFDFGEAASGFGRRLMRGQEDQLAESIGSQFPININTLLFGEGDKKVLELAATFAPQALLTPIELGFNYSTFRDRPISPARAEGLEGQLVYSPNTSKVAREIANGYKQLETVSGLPMGTLNPRYIDHGINSWLGTGGRLLTRTAGDAAATAITGVSPNNMEDIRDRAEKQFRSGEADTQDLSFPFRGMQPGEPIDSRRESSVLSNPFSGMTINPLTKKLISKNNYKGGVSVRQMYQVIMRAQDANKNLETMVQQGRPRNEIRDHVEENALYIGLARSSEGTTSTAGRFRKKLDRISENEEKIVNAPFERMSAAKKVERLQFNYDAQVDMAREFMDEMYKQMDRVYNGEFDTDRVVDNVMSSLPDEE